MSAGGRRADSARREALTATHWGVYRVAVEGGRIVGIRPFEGDADPSPIGTSMPGALTDTTRIAQPMVRAGYLAHGPRRHRNRRGSEPFVAVSWDEALDLAARALTDVKQRHGNEGIFGGSYGWGSAGRFHHALSHLHRFLNFHGGYVSSVNTYSTAAMEVILPHVMCPHYELAIHMPTWQDIAQHTQLVVAFGGMADKNMQVNAGGVGNHMGRGQLQGCRQAGVEFVNISPMRGDVLPDLGAQWLAPRPNTDVAIMLALAHTLVTEGRYDHDFIERCCVGFDRWRPYLLGETDGQPKSVEWAAGLSGLNAETLRQLARRIAERRTLITVSWSLQRADHGEQAHWAGVALAALSGSMGKVGGGFGSGYGAVHAVGSEPFLAQIAAVPQGRNLVKTFIPVARIADMLLHPGASYDYNGQKLTYPHIDLVYWAGGNPFHHHQDLARLVRAWQEPSTVIVHEPWWNPIARHADILFPATTMMERNDFACGWRDSYITAMHKAVDPVGQSRNDFDIFIGIAQRLGFDGPYTEGRSEMEWIRSMYDITRASIEAGAAGVRLPDFDEFWREGVIQYPRQARRPPLCSGLRENPAKSPIATPSGRVEIYSETIAGFGYDDCGGYPQWYEPYEWLGSPLAARFPLHLISNQPRTRLHSQYDNGKYSRESKVAGREPMVMHPQDAAARGLLAGDVVRVFNERGSCLAGLIVSDDIRPGVVQLATGAWYDPVEVAASGGKAPVLCAHGNPNALTRDRGTSKLAQGPSAHTALVEVEAWRGPAPPVRAFEPPSMVRREDLASILAETGQ